ncbi:hypothetical protein BDB00DRAFT_783048 [Zychaea mexicana]|uniref:uncharacterized protein n=1 Tax=Zychaea mexicana TaxID=64656 RepID=UPI0022FF300B|nr:uncharacterized protein BDB00DRAFT_783048 [Zychaea mexicana]KAI9499557.1 hypothetical protein BDB00DRAFT_783048 [Zychaea mexicana]
MTSSSSSARTSPSPSTPPPSINAAMVTAAAAAAAAGGTTSALKQRTGTMSFRDPAAPTIRTTVKQRARQNTISDDDFVRNLGADYQDVEKRTLTRWVNSQLAAVGDRIDRIETDLKDGKRLLKLLSVVSGQAAPKPERMNMRIHQLANVAQAFKFLETQLGADAMPDIGNEAIVNGDVKKTLALVFFIMLKYQIQAVLGDHGEDFMTSLSLLSEREHLHNSNNKDAMSVASTETDSTTELTAPATPRPSGRKSHHHNMTEKGSHTTSEAKVALLYWVRIQLEDYIAANIIPTIQDFSRSWRTGLAFCLLLHRHDPVLMPDLLTTRINNADISEKQAWREFLELAFDTADTKLNIPSYLDPDDLIDVEYPHEPSVMMYVSEYYKAMSKTQKDDPPAAKRDKRTKRRAAIAMAVGDVPEDEEDHDDDEIGSVICDTPPSMDDEPEELSTETLSQQQDKKQHEFHIKPIEVATKTPLEAPVPVPMPSARRHKRKPAHQRESTLGEEDKARIKADLNNRLMQQLTGHLPRGVHPVLDQLITIHETVISFIRTNTRTIDEIPEEFTSSSSVTEYVDALEIIEEQIESEAEYLDTAKEARDSLMSPPENAEESLMIRLTDLQRGQVDRLYDVLVKEWKELVDLLQSTKSDLLRLENDLIETEERVAEYEQQAVAVEFEISKLMDMLASVPPKNDQGRLLHPLDGSAESATTLDAYNKAVFNASSRIQSFDTASWKEYRAYLRELSPAVRQAVSQRHAVVEQRYQMLETNMRKTKRRFSLFKRGMAFGKVLAGLDQELMNIQKTMDEKQKAMTDDSILDLENRVSMVRSKMNGTREEYYDLFEEEGEDQAGFVDRFEQVQQRYRKVSDWVDQVRVWFIEAGRIRNWIEIRIATLQERKAFDPLSTDFVWLDNNAARLHREHDQLKREVERFELDDMTRLRTHVKKLTAVGRDQKLSPADASTIEITLETLNMLSKLTVALSKRSAMVNMLMLHVKWHELFSKADDWIAVTNKEVSVFLGGIARWTPSNDNDDDDEDANSKKKADKVIQTLVGLEKRIAEFDQRQYAQVLDAFQEMEDLHDNSTLPDHLEKRQTAFEQSFADLMKRSAFCRKVVEQHLVTVDVVAQFDHLKGQGEKLRREMDSQENLPGDRVQMFKESSAYWMSEVAATKIPYPQEAPEVDAVQNDEANARICKTIDDYGLELIEIVESLEELLVGHRQNMSLQERAKLVYDETARMTAWFDERIRNMKKSHPFALVEAMDEESDIGELERLENERKGTTARVHQIEESDYPKLLERMRVVEDEIDATNAVAIDRSMLINAIEGLEQSHTQLQILLEQRERELKLCRKHVDWMTAWNKVEETIIAAARDIWTFTVKKAKFDPGREEAAASMGSDTKEGDVQSNVHTLRDRVADIASQVNYVNDLQAELVSEASEEMTSAINTKQDELHAKQQELNNLLTYAASAADQRPSISHWLAQADKARDQGQHVRDELERRKQELEDGKVHSFKRLARSVYETSVGESVDPQGFGERLQWDFEVINPQDYHVRINAQIDALVQGKMSDLKQVEQEIDHLYGVHQSTGKLKQLVNLYDAEISELHQWIAEHMHRLKQQHLDALADVAESDFVERREKHIQLTSDIKQFENTNVRGLCDNIAQLSSQYQDQEGQLGVDVAAIEQRLDEVLQDMEELQSVLSDQTSAFDAALKRLEWESQYNAASMRLKDMNEQLREVMKQRDTANSDASNLGDRVCQWREELAALEKSQGQFVKSDLQGVEVTYRDLGKALTKCNRSTTVIPADIDARMDSLKHIQQRLGENLTARQDELASVKRRIDWQQAMDNAMDQLAKHEHDLETFVRGDARWTPDMQIREDDEQRLRNQYAHLVSKYKAFHNQQVAPLHAQFKVLQDEQKGPLPESTFSRMQALEKAEAQMSSQFTFATEVVTQHCLVSAFILRTDQLEQTAELIREEFLKEVNGDRLDQFKASVADVQDNLVRQIRYPVRSFKDDRIKVETRIQDEAVNEVIRDTIATRTSRLEELVASMEFQLESKETISRFQVQLHLYNRHAEACERWIESHDSALQQNNKLLNIGCERVLTMEELQQAISAVRGTERAMTKVKDNIFTSLENRFEQCVNAFDDTKATEEEERALAEEFDSIAAVQKRVSDKWHQLRDETHHVAIMLTDVLEPTEKHHLAEKLVGSLTSLQANIDEIDPATLTDEQILQWQKRVDSLDANEYRKLQSETPTFTEGDDLVKVPMEAAKSQLDTAGDMILVIRALLTGLYDTVNINRLRNTYSDNASVARNMMATVQTMYKDACQNVQVLTAKDRVAQRQAVLASHKNAQNQMDECKDAYEDLCGYYDFIKTQEGLGDELDDLHSQVQEEWRAVQAEQSTLAALVTRTDRWVERYDMLDKLQRSLSTVGRDLEEKHSARNYSSNTTSSSIKSRTSSSDSEASLLASLDKRLHAATRDLDELQACARSEGRDDPANSAAFVEECELAGAKVSSLKSSLSTRKFDLEKAHLLSTFTEELKRQCSTCEEQTAFLKQQANSNPTIAEKKPTAIQGVIQTYAAALANIRQIHGRCKANLESGVLSEQSDIMVDTYSFLRSEVERMKRPLGKALVDLEQKMTIEDEYVAVLKSVYRHAESESDNMASLNDFKATVARFSRSARIARTKGSLLPDLNEFERRFKAMEDCVQDFYAVGSKVKGSLLRDRVGGTRIASINRSVDRRQDAIKREWLRIKGSAEETKVKLQETQQRQHASGKLSEAMRYVSDLRHRVNTLQLSGKSISIEQQELKEIQDDLENALVKKLRDLDTLLASVSDKDGKFKRQRQELTVAVDDLHKLVQERQKEAEMEGNITLFVGIIDKMDEQISELSRLIDSCAPRHAQVVQSKFNKSDLQRLRRRLVSGYKEQEPKIAELVETAKSEARKQFVDNERVVDKLDKILEKWAKVQSEAAAREKELQTCINQLDHEFYTKLAMAKSTSPTNKSQDNKRTQRQRATPSPTKQRAGTRRASFRSSNLAVENINRSPRSRTPTSSASRNRPYVADPKNELDVHLGKIVNESPYRMKVKMVHGEVGKYWFGEEQPRLVYCRILPSKTVMVRVGGGWLELSTFLKNHGHSESNAAARSHPSDRTNDSVDSEASSMRSDSPSGRVTLRGGGRSPSLSTSRAGGKSPIPPTSTSRGYVDGDKYIRVDDEGNQVAVKMSKANDKARTLASNNKHRFT